MADREARDYCKTCTTAAKKKHTLPPCSECAWQAPELDPVNEEALSFWIEIQTQWRVGMSGPVGLDYNALYLEAGRLEIDLSNCFMAKIKALERAVLSGAKVKQEKKADQEKDPTAPATMN